MKVVGSLLACAAIAWFARPQQENPKRTSDIELARTAPSALLNSRDERRAQRLRSNFCVAPSVIRVENLKGRTIAAHCPKSRAENRRIEIEVDSGTERERDDTREPLH